MVKRTKHGPVNATAVLPASLVKALQRGGVGAGGIPSGTPVAGSMAISQQLEIELRAVTRLLVPPSPPYSRAVAARFDTPKARALLQCIQQHVEACVLYVPVAVSKVELRQRRIHRLFTLGWTPE